MPTQVASIGPALTLVQNQTYALPAKLCFLTALAAVDTSVDGITWVPLANATSGALAGSKFLRSTTANNIVVLKDASASQAGLLTAERQALLDATSQAVIDIDTFVALSNPSVPEMRTFMDKQAILNKLILVRLNQL